MENHLFIMSPFYFLLPCGPSLALHVSTNLSLGIVFVFDIFILKFMVSFLGSLSANSSVFHGSSFCWTSH